MIDPAVTYTNEDLDCERDNEEQFEETNLCKKWRFEFNADYDKHSFELDTISEDGIYELVRGLKEYLRDIRMYKSSKTNYEVEIIGVGGLNQDETFKIYNINEAIQNKIENIMGMQYKKM